MKEGQRLVSLLEFLRSVAFYILLAFLFVTFFFRPMQISGTSMTPSLLDGDRVMINVINNLLQDPQRFDVVVVRHEEELWVKRVIGLPNETIAYRDGALYVNGERMEEDFLDEAYMQADRSDEQHSDMKEITLGADEYLLVGDNRPESLDSRNSRVGAFSREDIIANGVLVFWPLNEVRYIG
ncbi:MAG: signal peptidase I [Merdibacter sp.]